MALIDKIKADQVEARKARLTGKATLLTTLLGEAQAIGKNANRETTDEEVVRVVKKFIKDIDFTLAQNLPELEQIPFVLEKAELSLYLPVQFTEDVMLKLIERIRELKGSKLELKDIMSSFKSEFEGMYDGKVLSTVAKAYIEAQV